MQQRFRLGGRLARRCYAVQLRGRDSCTRHVWGNRSIHHHEGAETGIDVSERLKPLPFDSSEGVVANEASLRRGLGNAGRSESVPHSFITGADEEEDSSSSSDTEFSESESGDGGFSSSESDETTEEESGERSEEGSESEYESGVSDSAEVIDDLSESSSSESLSSTFKLSEEIVQAQTQEVFANQLMIAESSSESEPEECGPVPSADSFLYKLDVRHVAKILRKLRAIDLVVLNVQARCQWTDYMVFATGRSTRHIRGMADRIVYAVKKRSTEDNQMFFPTVEGRNCQDWMVVDCGEIIVHVFSEEARYRYNLERKWGGEEVNPFQEDEEKEDEEKTTTDDPQTEKPKKMKRKITKRQKAAVAAATRKSSSLPPSPSPVLC